MLKKLLSVLVKKDLRPVISLLLSLKDVKEVYIAQPTEQVYVVTVRVGGQ